MTIALGILGSDGLVLAADSEHTWNYLKTSSPKLSSATGNGSIAITGSGTSGYLEGLSQRISSIFIGNPGFSIEELDGAFGAELRAFFEDHVIPFAAFATPPFCDLIIGVQRDSQQALWASTHASLRRCENYAATGFGFAATEK
jgi:hypothetical protein